MKNNEEVTTEIAIVDKETVENLIYIIRGQKVMLDADLAKIYGYTTKAFNQQVKNNIEKLLLKMQGKRQRPSWKSRTGQFEVNVQLKS